MSCLKIMTAILTTFIITPQIFAQAQPMTPREIYQQAAPGTVSIFALGNDGKGEQGTGSVIDDKGRILTNAHVVTNRQTNKPYEKILVCFKPKTVKGNKEDFLDRTKARLITIDSALDLALLEVEQKPSTLVVLPMGDSDKVQPGDPVVGIGNPESGGHWALIFGVVSTPVADLGQVPGKDAFQFTANINRGNSGGPLIAGDGAQIGINTSMARTSPDGTPIVDVNFAIQSNVVKNWLKNSRIAVNYAQPHPTEPIRTIAQAQAPEPRPIKTPAEPSLTPQAILDKGQSSASKNRVAMAEKRPLREPLVAKNEPAPITTRPARPPVATPPVKTQMVVGKSKPGPEPSWEKIIDKPLVKSEMPKSLMSKTGPSKEIILMRTKPYKIDGKDMSDLMRSMAEMEDMEKSEEEYFKNLPSNRP